MTFNIGINVVETNGTASPAIAGAPTSVAGLIFRSRRGPTDRAIRISNFRQFKARFGEQDARYVGAHCVDGFFLNGGREAYAARVVGENSRAASVTLQDASQQNTLRVEAGYRGASDVGIWGNDLYVDIVSHPEFSPTLTATTSGGNTPARLTSSLGDSDPYPIDLSTPEDAEPRSLVLTVDQGETTVISLDSTTLPLVSRTRFQDLANLINSAMRQWVVATVITDDFNREQLRITSRTKGLSSELSIESTENATLDLLGLDTITLAEGTAGDTYNSIQVSSIAKFSEGDWIRIEDGITRSWHQIETLTTTTVNGQLQHEIRWSSTPETNQYRVEDSTTVSSIEFDLNIYLANQEEPAPQQAVESWEKVSLNPAKRNYAPLRINDEFSGSSYIVLTALQEANFRGDRSPAPASRIRLGTPPQSPQPQDDLSRTAGLDTEPTTPDFTGALQLFDSLAIQLLAVLDDFVIDGVQQDDLQTAVFRDAIDYCGNEAIKGDCMFVGHTPRGREAGDAITFGQEFQASKVYGALYWPHITVTDPAGSGATPTKVIPPTGHILGVYARTDQTRGVWKAPAGNEAVVRGALAVERDITDRDHTTLVKNGSVNGIRRILGAGIVIDSSRTLSNDSRWLYVNVRLLFNYVKASLREGLRWVKQEPNRETLWNTIKYGTVRPFLLRLFQAGAFGPGTVDEVFTVICGPENNPPDQIQLGVLNVEVYFYPARPAETIIITIGQQDGGTTAGEQ